jgi:hypothetical protein
MQEDVYAQMINVRAKAARFGFILWHFLPLLLPLASYKRWDKNGTRRCACKPSFCHMNADPPNHLKSSVTSLLVA